MLTRAPPPIHPLRSAHRHSLRSVHPQRSAEVTPRASLQRRFPPTPDAPCPQFRMQFPKHITTIQSTNVEIPPFFNELINIRETKLHARFTKSVSLATNVRSRREGGAVGEREAQSARGRRSRREGGAAGEREAQPARGRRSRRTRRHGAPTGRRETMCVFTRTRLKMSVWLV